MDWHAIGLSLKLSAWTTVLLLALGLPLAAWLVKSRWRLKFLIEALVALPLVLPPTVLGYYLLMALGPLTPTGRMLEQLLGHSLAFTFEGLVVGSLIFSLPFSVQPFMAALSSVDARLVEASWCLGVSRTRTFFRVTLPLARPGILAGMVLTFAHTMGEFGVVLMLGGNLPGATRTISIAIYNDVQALEYASASLTAAVLLLMSFVVLAITYGLQRQALFRWPGGS